MHRSTPSTWDRPSFMASESQGSEGGPAPRHLSPCPPPRTSRCRTVLCHALIRTEARLRAALHVAALSKRRVQGRSPDWPHMCT
eukprot:357839-Chlamydomonas_euryale.AAC.4